MLIPTAPTPASESQTFPDFTFQGTTLTLPNRQNVEKVVGLQRIDKGVLVVAQREIGIYSLSGKRYERLSPPTPLSPTAELALVPFDAKLSSDRNGGKRFAFIAIKDATDVVGIFRYEAPRPAIAFLPFGDGKPLANAEFWSWYLWETDVRGAPPETRVSFLTTNGQTYYVTRLKFQWLGGGIPSPTDPIRRHLESAKAKFEARQTNLEQREP